MCGPELRLAAAPSAGGCAQGADGAKLRTVVALRDATGPERTSNSSGSDATQHALTQASDYIKLSAHAPDDIQPGHQVSDFIFGDSKRFADNCAAFLESLEEIDPEMAALLEANWGKLLAVVCDGERDSKARTTFNEAIAAALDDLLTQDAEAEGE